MKDIINHPFLKSIDFTKLEEMSLPAPHIPPISHMMDTSNFENYEFDPHSDSAGKDKLTDPTEGAWIEGF